MGELASGITGALIGGVLALVGGAIEARRERRLRARDEKVVTYLDYLRWHDAVKSDEVQQIPSDLSARLAAYGSSDVQLGITTSMYLEILGNVARESRDVQRRAAWSTQVALLHGVLAAAVGIEIRALRPRSRSPRAIYIRWRTARRIERDILMGEDVSLDVRARVRAIRESAEQAVRGT